MLDLIAALTFSAMFFAVVAVLVAFAPVRPITRWLGFAGAYAWASLLIAMSVNGHLAPGTTGPIPAPFIPLALLTGGLLVMYVLHEPFRESVRSIPLSALVGLHTLRIGGMAFLLLGQQGRLAAPFATVAGWGEVGFGLTAVALMGILAPDFRAPRVLIGIWNAMGTLQLAGIAAAVLLSSPGAPLAMLAQAPGLDVLTTVPWVGYLGLMMPLYLLTHIGIGARLAAQRPEVMSLPERERVAGRGYTWVPIWQKPRANGVAHSLRNRAERLTVAPEGTSSSRS